MRNLYLNRKGMTLLEILIVAAIMGILALGFATMFKNAYKNEANLAAKQAGREFRDEIEYSIAGNNCGLPLTFLYTNGDPKAAPLHNIKSNVEIPIFSESEQNLQLTGPRGTSLKYGTKYDNLTVVAAAIGPFLPALNMQLTSLIFPSPDLLAGAAYTLIVTGQPYYSGEIRITLKKPAGATTQPNVDEYVISRHLVLLNVDAAKNILGCLSFRYIADAKSLCENNLVNGAGGVWNGPENLDIEYPMFTCLHEATDEVGGDGRLDFLEQGGTTALKLMIESN